MIAAGFEYILSPYIENGNAKPEKYSNIQTKQLCFTNSFPNFEYFLNTFETCFWEARFYAGSE